MSVIPIREADTVGGTLLWIGDPTVPEFHGAHEYCVDHVSQIARRRSTAEAIARPAERVGRIVFARRDTRPLKASDRETLARRYPGAASLELLGPLCEGMRRASALTEHRVAWHRWDQVLPKWLGATQEGCEQGQPDESCSLAVLSNRVDAAQTYLDLASSLGIVAAWCEYPSSMRIRNVCTVWWDDSVAGPATPELWRQRVAIFAHPRQDAFHVWITHDHGGCQRHAAIAGGIDAVISKPYEVDALLLTIQGRRKTQLGRQNAA